jgi:hypothetical protein
LQKTAILGTAPHPEDTNLALNLIQMYFPWSYYVMSLWNKIWPWFKNTVLCNMNFVFFFSGKFLGLLVNPEDGGSMFLQIISQLLSDNMASHSLIECLLNKNLVYMYICSQSFVCIKFLNFNVHVFCYDDVIFQLCYQKISLFQERCSYSAMILQSQPRKSQADTELSVWHRLYVRMTKIW